LRNEHLLSSLGRVPWWSYTPKINGSVAYMRKSGINCLKEHNLGDIVILGAKQAGKFGRFPLLTKEDA